MDAKTFIQKINSKEAKVLTLDLAKTLKGKTIYWMVFGYSENSLYVEQTIVGDVVSDWDYASSQDCKGYSNLAEYWGSYMTSEQISERKNKLLLLDSNGSNTFMFCEPSCILFNEPTFVCSDSDREVYFLVCE